jgi:dTDP-4-amino-4,6-dideoxygalactose transaminase
MAMIPFNKPYMTGEELEYIREAHRNGHLSGEGPFTRRCHAWLEERIGCDRALLTHSCTAALEMAAILTDVGPGDEVVMPSFTFVSTANAFVLRGAVPVFVDIRPDTLNIDERLIEAAVTSRTKAIAVVHYAGVACDMDPILEIARRHRLPVIEDAAQGIMCAYRGRPLGSFGQLAALSFHETKNVISGEGGALLLNDPALVERAETVREKGTNRSRFFRGQVDKYTWVDIGSSYLPSEIVAAFLYSQMQHAESITTRRLALWEKYHARIAGLEQAGRLRRPVIPDYAQHNAHMYYVLAPDAGTRTKLLEHLRAHEIGAIFHYIPLHSSPAGRRYGRTNGELPVTDAVSERLVRLPLWIGLEDEVIDHICGALAAFFR